MQKRRPDNNIFCTYGAVSIGILIGCLYFLFSITHSNDLLMSYGLEDYDISVMLNAPYNEIVIHILSKRLLQIVIFILLVCLTTFSCASFVFCSGFGVYYGIVVSSLIVKYGVPGLLYSMVCFFPHYLLYFCVIILCGRWRWKEKNSFYKCNKDMNKMFYWGKFFVIILLLILSFVWEIKFQKNFLNYFFQHLV